MSSVEAIQLPLVLATPLRRFVVARRRAATIRRVAQVLMFTMIWLIAWGLVDRFVSLTAAARIGLLAGLVAIWAIFLKEVIPAVLRRSIDWQAAARQMEQRRPQFKQALATVVSQTLLPSRARGSSRLNDQLLQQVSSELQELDGQSLVPSRPVLISCAGTALCFAVVFSLSFWPWLNLQRLVARQIFPMSGVRPVTSTVLVVNPGAVEVRQGNGVSISAQVHGAPVESVVLRTTTDGRAWASTGMAPAADGSFTRTLSGISRDTTYEIQAGDASSGPYLIRVMRQPIVREMRVHLTYPDYVGRAALTMIDPQSSIEVPAGTAIHIEVAASEPLRSAWFLVNGQRLPAAVAEDDHSRQLDLTIANDTHLELEMVSDRGARNPGLAELNIRAISDRPPLVRMQSAENFTLLRPTDSVRLPYQVSDDYALAALEQRVEIDGKSAGTVTIPIDREAHRVEGWLSIDLKQFNPRIGQVISIRLAATDRAGQASVSSPAEILVTPEAVQPIARRRLADLAEAEQLSRVVVAELQNALPDDPSAENQQSTNLARRMSGRLAVAAERSAALVQLLIRSAVGATGDADIRPVWLIADAAQRLSLKLDALGRSISTEILPANRASLTQARADSAALTQTIRSIAQRNNAQLILAERRAVAQVQDVSAADLSRLRETIDTEVEQLRLEPRALDLDQQLQSRITAAEQLLVGFPSIDLAGLARSWARGSDPDSAYFAERIALAAQIESARTDGDVQWSKDLQLAAAAVQKLGTPTNPPDPSQSDLRNAFVAPFESLVQAHAMRLNTPTAEAARHMMTHWSTGAEIASANATTRPSIFTNASRVSATPSPDATEARDLALSSIRQAQQTLADLPRLLGGIEQQAQVTRSAQSRLRDALREVEAAPPEELPAARRVVEAARVQVDENYVLLAHTADPIDLTSLSETARLLRPFSTDSASAVDALERQAIPALMALRQFANDRNAQATERQVIDTRRAVAAVQQGLREARQALLERDPAITARSFAQQSAATQPSTQAAVSFDQFRRGWDQTLLRLGDARVTKLSDGPITIIPTRIATTMATSQPSNESAMIGQSSLQREWTVEDLNDTSAESSPEEYRDALNLYFQVLRGTARERRP